ncbi:LASP1 protein, partial [Origma solitaria]|nr:LASP1 protein [Origma solitaria]
PCPRSHYPKQSFTMVADTPENLRLKQQSELQSQIRYKEEFEKNKGKGFSVVADTPELQRIKKTQDQISNIKYHEEFERSRMGPVPSEAAEPERRNSQESSGYRRAAEQQHQAPHLVQPSATGTARPRERGLGAMNPQSMDPSFHIPERCDPIPFVPSVPSSLQKTFRAMYDYTAADADEVSFKDGDTIVNVQAIDEGWMYGTVQRTGKTGMLPANYVEAI